MQIFLFQYIFEYNQAGNKSMRCCIKCLHDGFEDGMRICIKWCLGKKLLSFGPTHNVCESGWGRACTRCLQSSVTVNNTIQDTSRDPSVVLTGQFSCSNKKISSALRPVSATSHYSTLMLLGRYMLLYLSRHVGDRWLNMRILDGLFSLWI